MALAPESHKTQSRLDFQGLGGAGVEGQGQVWDRRPSGDQVPGGPIFFLNSHRRKLKPGWGPRGAPLWWGRENRRHETGPTLGVIRTRHSERRWGLGKVTGPITVSPGGLATPAGHFHRGRPRLTRALPEDECKRDGPFRQGRGGQPQAG